MFRSRPNLTQRARRSFILNGFSYVWSTSVFRNDESEVLPRYAENSVAAISQRCASFESKENKKILRHLTEIRGNTKQGQHCKSLPVLTYRVDKNKIMDPVKMLECPSDQLLKLFVSILAREDDGNMSTVEFERISMLKSQTVVTRRRLLLSLVEMSINNVCKGKIMKIWQRLQGNWLGTIANSLDRELWKLDLHGSYPLTAKLIVWVELSHLRAKAMAEKDFIFPSRAEIVTGWGKRSQLTGNSTVKRTIQEFLFTIGSPFKTSGGFLYADGEQLRHWLTSNGTGAKLEAVYPTKA